ncbi:MAG TPA: DUF3870 domain-containing protein [Spirochaetia bacterium]|nr:DUF3870 domain-containing protein [Spirochaetia bacterium]
MPATLDSSGGGGPLREETIFFSGYAKLPAGITASAMFNVVAVGLEVEAPTGRIVAAECTLATGVGKSFFSRLVVGWNIDTGLPGLIEEIERRYQGSAQKAIITALKIIHEKFRAYRFRDQAPEKTEI